MKANIPIIGFLAVSALAMAAGSEAVTNVLTELNGAEYNASNIEFSQALRAARESNDNAFFRTIIAKHQRLPTDQQALMEEDVLSWFPLSRTVARESPFAVTVFAGAERDVVRYAVNCYSIKLGEEFQRLALLRESVPLFKWDDAAGEKTVGAHPPGVLAGAIALADSDRTAQWIGLARGEPKDSKFRRAILWSLGYSLNKAAIEFLIAEIKGDPDLLDREIMLGALELIEKRTGRFLQMERKNLWPLLDEQAKAYLLESLKGIDRETIRAVVWPSPEQRSAKESVRLKFYKDLL